MTLYSFLFWTLATLTGLCALGVVVTQNIVRCAAWLLLTMGGVAGIFFLLGADFVGATQLLVYVGGIMVLVVFGVMLTAQGPFISLRTSPAEWAVSTVVGIALYAVLAVSTVWAAWPKAPVLSPEDPARTSAAMTLGEGFLGLGVGPGGRGYLLPFEIVSVHLLVVLIGAAYLARAKRRAAGEKGWGMGRG
jgi:NADH:ubiquinone oxidoreductase subunit 6 (subunit J)